MCLVGPVRVVGRGCAYYRPCRCCWVCGPCWYCLPQASLVDIVGVVGRSGHAVGRIGMVCRVGVVVGCVCWY